MSDNTNIKPKEFLNKVLAGAAFVGSGVTTFNSELGVYVGSGTGDIINTMITASVAVILILLIGEKFGSVNIILSPILIGAGFGLVGPLASIDAGLNIFVALCVWIIIPALIAILSLVIFEKVLKLYKKEEAFAYLG